MNELPGCAQHGITDDDFLLPVAFQIRAIRTKALSLGGFALKGELRPCPHTLLFLPEKERKRMSVASVRCEFDPRKKDHTKCLDIIFIDVSVNCQFHFVPPAESTRLSITRVTGPSAFISISISAPKTPQAKAENDGLRNDRNFS